MKRRIISLGAASLLVIGFFIGFITNLNGSGASAADQTPATTATANTSTVSSIDVDNAIENAFLKVQKSVVFVDTAGVGTGSGIVYDTTGDIVTNDHVVTGGNSFKVTLYNGKTYRATLTGTDPADDLAVLKISAPNLVPASFAPASSYRLAETVLAVGSPLGLQNSVTDGLISGLNRTEEEPTNSYIPDAIQTSAPINPGNSGGALANLSGEVVGIPTIVQTSTTGDEPVQDVGFAIPSSRVTFIVPQIIKDGHVTNTGRAFLGVSVTDSAQGSGFYGQQTSSATGAYVQTAKAGDPANKSGIEAGDVIVAFDGKRITSSNDLLKVLAEVKPGQSVGLTYNRNGSDHHVTVVLGELPATQ